MDRTVENPDFDPEQQKARQYDLYCQAFFLPIGSCFPVFLENTRHFSKIRQDGGV